MSTECQQKLKALSRFLSVPKSDIQYTEDSDEACTAPYIVLGNGDPMQYLVLYRDEAEDLLYETVEWDVTKRFKNPEVQALVKPYLDNYVKDNCPYFDTVALEQAKEYLETLSDEEYNQMAFDWGLLSEDEAFGDAELSWEEIYNLRDEFCEKQVEEWEIEYNGLKNWYIDTFGDAGLYVALLTKKLNYEPKDLISDIISDYGFNYLSCDGNYETVRDYYIIRVE